MADRRNGALATRTNDQDATAALLATISAEDRVAIEAAMKTMIVAGREEEKTPNVIVAGAALLARSLGLRLDLGHVMVWKGRKSEGGGNQRRWVDTYDYFVTADGWAAWGASQVGSDGQPLYAGMTFETLDRKAKRDLLIERREGEQKLARRCLVYRRAWREPAEGIGIADPEHPHGERRSTDRKTGEATTFGGNPVERSDPRAMADARAARQAFKRAFPISDQTIERAHRAASRALEAGERIDLRAVGTAASSAVAELPEPERQPTDDWKRFWVACSDAGLSREHVYDALMVAGFDVGDPPSVTNTRLSPRETLIALGLMHGDVMDDWQITRRREAPKVRDLHADYREEPVVEAEIMADTEPPAAAAADASHSEASNEGAEREVPAPVEVEAEPETAPATGHPWAGVSIPDTPRGAWQLWQTWAADCLAEADLVALDAHFAEVYDDDDPVRQVIGHTFQVELGKRREALPVPA